MVLGMIATAVGAVAFFQLVYFIYKSMTRPSDFPPGPRGVPILGSLHYLGKYPQRGMIELAKKYGNIFSLKFAEKNFVCVCGFEANRDVLLKMKLTDRRVIYAFKMVKGVEPSGVLHNNHWPPLVAYRELIHDFFSKKILVKYTHESATREAISKVMKDFKNLSAEGKTIPIPSTLINIGLDVNLRLLFGNGMPDIDNEEFSKFMKLRQDISSLQALYIDDKFMIPEIIPWLPKFLLPKSSKMFLINSKAMMDYAENEVKKHINTIDPKNLRDLVDCYLIKMKGEEEMRVADPIFTHRNLMAIIYDFFLAGVENMKCVTGFAALYLAGHQAIQNRLREEVEKVLSSSDAVELCNINDIPYAKATVYEVFRYSNIAPNGVPRKASKPLKFHGYSIPKGTTFLLNTYSSHFQGDKWKNAKNFDPENFLNESGEFQRNEAYMPFGLGLRKCPGESLMEHFLFKFIITLVQRFNVEPESAETKIDYEPLPGLVATPKPQKIRFTPRG